MFSNGRRHYTAEGRDCWNWCRVRLKTKQFADDVNHAQSPIPWGRFVRGEDYFKTYIVVILRKTAILALRVGEVSAAENQE
jgi:DNA-directed RNA polymerase specialized sigma24 family protein